MKPSTQAAYSVASGTSPISAPIQEPRNPTSLDTNYTLYEEWVNTSTGIKWQLISFNSSSGTVLANWVQFATSANSVQNLTVDAFTAPGTNPVVPSGVGFVTITGAQVATGTVGANVLRTDSLAANSLTIEVQRSTSVAATDSTKNGVSHFNSVMFTVDGSGFVSLAGGGLAIDSFHPDSGTDPVVPTAAGLVNMAGSGSITTVGSLNTLTTQLTGLTNHAVLVGAGTTTITNVGPGAAGAPLLGAGAITDPGFSTKMTVTDATGLISLTASSGGGINVAGSVSGAQIPIQVQNTNASANSHASLIATTVVGGGDSFVGWTIGSATSYSLGIDNPTGGDPLKLTYAAGSSVTPSSGATLLAIASSGAVTFNNAYTFPTADGTSGQVLTTNGSGTLSFHDAGVTTWSDTSGVFTASRNTGYFLTAASTATLPASPSQGDAVDFVCDTTGSCVITANTGQFIRISNQLSSSAGTATNSARGDSLSLVYRSATTTWFADASPNGGWTTA